MAHDSSSDLGVGVGATLSVIALLAAAWLAVTDPTATLAGGMHATAVPFAVALAAGVAAIAGIHLLWDE